MRKAIVLVAVLAGLALAASRWIGYVPTSVSALPRNLENAPQAVLPPGGTSLTNTDTLKYDDNAPANAWASYVVGNGFGTKFVRPADPITLDGTMIYLWDSSWPVPGVGFRNGQHSTTSWTRPIPGALRGREVLS